MSKYYAEHLIRLQGEAQRRFDGLMRAIETDDSRGDDLVIVDGVQIRMAVDDFKVLLAEVRKIK